MRTLTGIRIQISVQRLNVQACFVGLTVLSLLKISTAVAEYMTLSKLCPRPHKCGGAPPPKNGLSLRESSSTEDWECGHVDSIC